MSNLRIMPRLDIKGPNLIKDVQLEGLRVMGDPQALAVRYHESGADEVSACTTSPASTAALPCSSR